MKARWPAAWPAWLGRGVHAWARLAGAAASAAFVGAIGIELLPTARREPSAPVEAVGEGESESLVSQREVQKWLEEVQRRQLFKPAAPLPVRSMARDSVKRVRDSVSLHGIMDLGGRRVAYIKVKGLGMKAYRAGDQEEGLFKILQIEERRVELEIVGERVELEL